MKYAFQMVKQYGMHAEGVESDNLSLINGLNSQSKPEIYYDILIAADIKMLAAEIECTTFEIYPQKWQSSSSASGAGTSIYKYKAHTSASSSFCIVDADINI